MIINLVSFVFFSAKYLADTASHIVNMSIPVHSVVNQPASADLGDLEITNSALPREDGAARIFYSHPSIPEAYHFEGA